MSEQTKRKAPADLEKRFLKKWGNTMFAGMVNTVPTVVGLVTKELTTQLKVLEKELKEAGEDAADIFEIDTNDAEEAILIGPQDKVLTRVLYRMSVFFFSMKVVSISYVKKGNKLVPAVRLHAEKGSLRTVESVDPLDLDPFNQYVFLHLLPFVKEQWHARRQDNKWRKFQKAVEDVVQHKIEALRTEETTVDEE